MKNISKILADTFYFRYIAEIFILNFGGITSICGSLVSKAKVWIKVCNSQSRGPACFPTTPLIHKPYSHTHAVVVSICAKYIIPHKSFDIGADTRRKHLAELQL